MINTNNPEYILTIVQHTYCGDCMWLKGKITDTYHASGIVRGDDSKQWRVNILSPPWDRDARRADFPDGFKTIDVPALKLEVNDRIALATQDPSLINELLIRLKWMLLNRLSNSEIEDQMVEIAREWKGAPEGVACLASD